MGLDEGRERAPTPNVTPDRCKPFVEAADDVEDESAVLNGFAEIGEVVGHALELLAVIGDGEITLHKSSELGVEDEGASLTVAQELGLDGEPSGASGGAAVAPSHDDVDEVAGESRRAMTEPRNPCGSSQGKEQWGCR